MNDYQNRAWDDGATDRMVDCKSKQSWAAIGTSIAAAIVLFTVAVSAVAQTSESDRGPVLEEVIVTAQKQAQNLQDVGLTVQTLSGEEVSNQGVYDLEFLSEGLVSVSISRTASAQRIVMRGITTGTNEGFEQSVGMFVDGVYRGRAQFLRAPFMDIEQVEVLKGPQAVLFGTNVTAGAFNISTGAPTRELFGSADFLIGDNSESVFNGVISGPLSESWAGRAAIYHRSYDGYMTDTTNSRTLPAEEHWGGRLSLLYEPSDVFSLRISWEHFELNQDGTNAQIVFDPIARDSLSARFGDPGLLDYENTGNVNPSLSVVDGFHFDDNLTDALTLSVEYDLGFGTLFAVTGYTEYDWDVLTDSDYSSGFELLGQTTFQTFDQLSQELRIAGSLADDRVQYIIGAYFQTQDLEFTRFTEINPSNLTGAPVAEFHTADNLATQSYDSAALFGQVEWALLDQLRLVLGGRISRDEKDARDILALAVDGVDVQTNFLTVALGAQAHDVSGNRVDEDFSWLARVEYDRSADTMFYASASRAYKAGGFDLQGLGPSAGSVPDPNFEFENEEVTSFELGAKTIFNDAQSLLNVALFHTIYEDLQVSLNTGVSFRVGNAAESQMDGVEVEYQHLLSDNWRLGAHLAYLDHKYESYANAPCTVRQRLGLDPGGSSNTGTCDQDLSGKVVNFSPEWASTVSLAYERPVRDLRFIAELDAIYTDEYYFDIDLDPNVKQAAYTKFNARIAVADEGDQWEIALIGRNLTDEIVGVNSFDSVLPLSYAQFVLPPRTWAAQFKYRFW